jgi:N-acetylneuraminate synthase
VPIKIIAEIGSNHNQDLERTIKLIEEAKRIGCDAVKFQLFKADNLYRHKKQQDNVRPHELPESFIPIIAQKCKKLNIQFGCTPFDYEAIKTLWPFVDFYKIASYDLLRRNFIKKVCEQGKPVIISTGMLTEIEIAKLMGDIRGWFINDISFLHCVADYPVKIDDCNISLLPDLFSSCEFKGGWSDHSREEAVLYAAAGAGAEIIEFHMDLDDFNGYEYRHGHCWPL